MCIYRTKYLLPRKHHKSWAAKYICWLNKVFASGLAGSSGARQLLAYFKYLKIIFNKKKGGNEPERESSPRVFARRCPGNKHCLQRGRAGGSTAVGSARGNGGVSISAHPLMPAQESRTPLTL